MILATRASSWYLAGAVAVGLFIIHGSLVPYDFISRPFEEIPPALKQKLHELRYLSISDLLANWLLGVPLGFCLLGAFRVDRPAFLPTLGLAVLLFWPCLILSIAVEFAQLYCPNRICAFSDVVAQSAGVVAGQAAWMLFGQRLTEQLRWLASHPWFGGPPGLRLLLYYGFLLLLQILPADLTISPKMLYIRFRHGDITLIPFADWFSSSRGLQPATEALIHLLLCLPLGYLLARWPTGSQWFRLVGVGAVLCVLLEVAQIIVISRHPSTTEFLCGWLGVMIGSFTLRNPETDHRATVSSRG